MRCLSCKTINPRGNRFCEQCGSQLQQSCARCGHDVAPTARFCGNCGHALSSAAAPIAEGAPKWGELKQATVLFADIVGSTELIGGLDPEEAMARLRPAVLRMCHSVERFGGTVVRTLGDGVMALFGVPNALEGHALLACQAALHMQKAFAPGGDGLMVRIGLHSGQVASDPLDAKDGHGGGAHGLTIHLASRVVGTAQPGHVCITDACRVAAGASCETMPLGMHALKGIRDEVVIHQLVSMLGAQPAGTGAEGSTFRGRHHEIGALQNALGEAQQGASRVVGIVGEPGAGKSRLCQEFTDDCRDQGIPVYEVRAQLYGHALPLQPILELFRVHFFGIGPHDDAATARAHIARRFAAVQASDADFAILYDFFGVGAGDPAHPLGPRARQARLLTLLKELLRAEADVQRVILIEDLHWLDEGSEEFVSLLVDAAAGTHTLLLLNYRPSYRCPWLQLRHYLQVELHELAEGDMDSLVAELLAPATQSPEVRRLVCQRAGGNPFFAEELVRSLVESHVFSRDTGLPVNGLEAVERALPVTVEAVVGARLDRIGEPEKTLLQMCAIIGKDIPLAVLEHVASPLASQIERGLEGLCRAGLILPQPTDGGRRFAFRHPLIQEVAYGTQFKLRRGQIHADVAAAMELYYSDRQDEYAGLIAYHFEAANLHLPAARFMARAAQWVATASSARATTGWRKVRSLLDKCTRSPEVDRLRAFASGRIVYLGWREGLSLEEVDRLTHEALELATEADARLVQLLLFARGRLIQSSGGPADDYAECVERALAMPGIRGDAGRTATLQLALSHAYTWSGRLHDALRANDEALRGLAQIDRLDRDFIGFSVEQWAHGIRARLLNRMGRFEESRHMLEKLRAMVDVTAADPVMKQIAHYAHVDLAWCSKDADLARCHAHAALRIADEESSPYSKVLAYASQGVSAQVAGELQAARDQYAHALRVVRDTRVAVDFEAEILAGLAECLLEMGDFAAAAQTSREAISVSRQRSNRVSECRALITLATALAAADEALHSSEIASTFHDAEALLDRTGAAVFAPALARVRTLAASLRDRFKNAPVA